MARRKKEQKITDPFERARLKKLRSAQRREERKKRKAEAGDTGDRSSRKESSTEGYSTPMVKDDYLWIRADRAKAFALAILNNHRNRPYWLSIDNDPSDRPISNFFPCTTFFTDDRVYYGFLFREHRDQFFATLDDARKEYTDRVRSINPALFS